MTSSYFFHRRYSMSWQRSCILITEHALNRQPVPLIGASSHSNLCVSVKNLLKSTPATLPQKKYFLRSKTKYHDTTCQESPFLRIKCFHSSCQHLCKFIRTKESGCIRKEYNSQRIGLGHQHGYCFIVLGHQYCRRDVTWKHSIRERLCMNRVRSLLSTRGKLLEYSFRPRSDSRSLGTAGSVRTTDGC